MCFLFFKKDYFSWVDFDNHYSCQTAKMSLWNSCSNFHAEHCCIKFCVGFPKGYRGRGLDNIVIFVVVDTNVQWLCHAKIHIYSHSCVTTITLSEFYISCIYFSPQPEKSKLGSRNNKWVLKAKIGNNVQPAFSQGCMKDFTLFQD